MRSSLSLLKLQWCVVAMAVAGMLPGCKTTTRSGLPPQVISEAELERKIDDFPELKAFPVIDIHSHTFNARYLPIRNIALASRYDALPFGLGYFVPDELVLALGAEIVRRTTLNGDGFSPRSNGLVPLTAKTVEASVSTERDSIARSFADPKIESAEPNG